jgi:hypothetical protein
MRPQHPPVRVDDHVDFALMNQVDNARPFDIPTQFRVFANHSGLNAIACKRFRGSLGGQNGETHLAQTKHRKDNASFVTIRD